MTRSRWLSPLIQLAVPSNSEIHLPRNFVSLTLSFSHRHLSLPSNFHQNLKLLQRNSSWYIRPLPQVSPSRVPCVRHPHQSSIVTRRTIVIKTTSLILACPSSISLGQCLPSLLSFKHKCTFAEHSNQDNPHSDLAVTPTTPRSKIWDKGP